MREYGLENGKQIDLKLLCTSPMSKKEYAHSHKHLVIACHDVAIIYQGGILLVTRDNSPAKNILWVIGGRILRGMSTVDSLRQKVKAECGLELTDIKELMFGRTYFSADPFGHGKGTDTFNIAYVAQGSGKIKLDTLHKQPIIVTPKLYTTKFRRKLHPYVRDIVDRAMPFIGKS